MRTLAIGDIHGCHIALASLLKKVRPKRGEEIIFLGDYIDRGPASREVVETLLEFGKTYRPYFLRGNHEVMILEALKDAAKEKDWEGSGGLETLYSYRANLREDWFSAIPKTHWKFFERTVKFVETKTHIFVHAGLNPKDDMKKQSEDVLYWETFDQLQPHKSGKTVVCGHTRQASGVIKDVGFAICIDTGAATGGWLTCLDTSSRKYWQADEKGNVREGTL